MSSLSSMASLILPLLIAASTAYYSRGGNLGAFLGCTLLNGTAAEHRILTRRRLWLG